MPRTELLATIQEIARSVAQERAGKVSRRRVLGGLAAAAAWPSIGRAGWQPRIAIVGGGLAGLTCAYRLVQNGLDPLLFDANDRLGGRCWTLRGAFADGQIIERGGELIDQGHTAIRQLAQELGLELDNLLAAEKNGTEPVYFFDGQPYSVDEARRDLRSIWKKLHRDLSAAGYPTTYLNSTPRGRELDQMSISAWIDETVPGGRQSRLGQLLEVAYAIEYGAEAEEQSALNLIYLLGYLGPGQLRLFGASNEKYHVNGGNDRIVAGLSARVGAGRIRLGRALRRIRRESSGAYTLEFQTATGLVQQQADLIVLALPFSILRTLDYSQAGFRPLKVTAIQEQGMGANAKLQLQFKSRHWEKLGSNGESYADTGYQLTWDVSRGQTGSSGILVNYTGGSTALQAGARTPGLFLSELEPVLPGITAEWNGRSHLENWPSNPLTRGSYSFYRPGQWQQFAGIEAEPEGDCYFCGEHTSIDFQGYLNGAVDSGERAAKELVARIGRT